MGKEQGADLTLSVAVLRSLGRWSPRGSAENSQGIHNTQYSWQKAKSRQLH